MKKYLFLTVIVVMAALCCALVGCNNKASVTQVEVELPNKSSYYKGEALDLTGCVLVVSYDDGETKEVQVTPDMVSGFDSSRESPQTVVVEYQENGKYYYTSMVLHVVSRPAAWLEMDTPPQKSEYVVGDNVDLTGLKVKVFYTEQEWKVVGLSELRYNAVTTTEDTTAVKVYYDRVSLDVPITIVPETAIGVEAHMWEEQLVYNQLLTKGSFLVQFVYNTKRYENVSDFILQEDGTRVDHVGEVTVHITAHHPTDGDFQCAVTMQAVPDTIIALDVVDAPYTATVGDALRWQDVSLRVRMRSSTLESVSLHDAVLLGITADVADGTVWQSSQAAKVNVRVANSTVNTAFVVAVDTVAVVRLEAAQAEQEVSCVEGSVPTPVATLLYAVYSDDATQEGGHRVLVWNRFRAATGIELEMPAPCQMGDTVARMGYEGVYYTYSIQVLPQ